MIVVFSIVAVVALISLYDYFNTRSWQQVTSNVRNNAVFEKRNRAYGAYTIRRDYNKRILIILIGMIGGTSLLYAATRNKEITEEIKLPEVGPTIYIEPKDEVKPEIPVEVETQPEMKMAEVIEFREPVITDKPDVIDLKDLADENKNTGNQKNEGEEGGFDDIPPIKKGPVEPPIIEPPITPSGPVTADEPAEYIGGRPAMQEFIQKNLRYPDYAQQAGIEGRCFLKFVVSKKGDISAVTVSRGVTDCPECDSEAVRVVKKMPLWKPGKTNGKPVDSYFNMPIGFALE